MIIPKTIAPFPIVVLGGLMNAMFLISTDMSIRVETEYGGLVGKAEPSSIRK